MPMKNFCGFSDDSSKSEAYCKRFRQTAKSFYGFIDDNGKSEEYYRRFECMKNRSLGPVVVLERLPKTIVGHGKNGKRLHVFVNSRPRLPNDHIATKTVDSSPESFSSSASGVAPELILTEDQESCTDIVQDFIVDEDQHSIQPDSSSLTCQTPLNSKLTKMEIINETSHSLEITITETTTENKVDRPRTHMEDNALGSSMNVCPPFSTKADICIDEEKDFQTRRSLKRKLQHSVVCIPTKRDCRRPKCSDELGMGVKIVHSFQETKDGSEPGSVSDEIESTNFCYPDSETSPSETSVNLMTGIESQNGNSGDSTSEEDLENYSSVNNTNSLACDGGIAETDVGIVNGKNDHCEGPMKSYENEQCKSSNAHDANGDSFLNITNNCTPKPESIHEIPSVLSQPAKVSEETEGTSLVPCSAESESDDSKQGSVIPLLDDELIGSISKSVDHKQPEDDIGIDDEVADTLELSEDRSFKNIWITLKPCVVKLTRLPGFGKIAPKTEETDVDSSVVFTAGQEKSMCRINGPSNGSPEHMKRLSEIDLSDGLALKKLCLMKSIDVDGFDRNNELCDRMAEGCSQIESVSLISDSEENRASKPPQFHLLADRVSSPNLCYDVVCKSEIADVDPPSDSVVSENPVPSGVQALNELGFLDNEPFRFGKIEAASENIWCDVLEFDHPSCNGNLLPFQSDEPEDLIHGLDPEKPIEVDLVSGKVTISTGFKIDRSDTISIKSKRDDNVNERVDDSGNNILDSLLSDKEYLMNDPLMSQEDTETLDVNNSKSSPGESMGECEFLNSLINPEKRLLKPSQDYNDDHDDHDDHPGSPQDLAKESLPKKKRKKKNNEVCTNGLSEVENCEETPKSRPSTMNSKPVPRKYKRRNRDNKNYSDQTDRDTRAMQYRASTCWLTKSLKDDKGKEIKVNANEEVPTSETLYRDLSTIPYVMKCNFQNRSRKCKNLNPCANANKNFKLFFTLTVGVGRRLAKQLIETVQDPEDSCVITRTSAYIAASAAVTYPTTILIPAMPEVVHKILPVHHSKLLTQLVAETEEIGKKEKRSISDMAIAETLQFKRALMAMKARFPDGWKEHLMPAPLRSCLSSEPNPPQPILSVQSAKSKSGFTFKSNQIIAVKSRMNNNFRFAKKSLVSILPKDKGLDKSEKADNENKPDDSIQPQLIGIKEEQNSEVVSGSPKKRPKACLDSSENYCSNLSTAENGMDQAKRCSGDANSPGLNEFSSIISAKSCGTQEGRDELSPKQRELSSFDSQTTISSQMSRQSQNTLTRAKSLIKLEPCQAAEKGLPLFSNVDHLQVDSCPSSSSTNGIGSEDSEDNSNTSTDDERPSDQTQTKIVTHMQSLLEPKRHIQGIGNTGRLLSSRPSNLAVPYNKIRKDGSANLPDRMDSADVVLVPDKVESVDLTACDEPPTAMTPNFPKCSVICSSMPQLGFVRVQKVSDKVLIYDRSVVSDPLEFDSVQDLSMFLNSRLTEHPEPPQSKMGLKWVLVTSSYLALKNLSPTDSRLWLNSPATGQCGTAKVAQLPKKAFGYVSYSEGVGGSSSITQMSVKPRRGPIPKYTVSPHNTRTPYQRVRCIDQSGKVVRVNGQAVVIGTPAHGATTKDMKVAKPISTISKAYVKPIPQGGNMRVMVAGDGHLMKAGSLNAQLVRSKMRRIRSDLIYSSAKNSETVSNVSSSYEVVESSLARKLKVLSSPTLPSSSLSPMASISGSSIKRLALPASSGSPHATSHKKVPSRIIARAPVNTPGCPPQYLILPAAISPSGQATKYVLASSKSTASTIMASSPQNNNKPELKMRPVSGFRSPSVSGVSTSRTPIVPGAPAASRPMASKMPTTKIVSAASMHKSPQASNMSIPIRAPFKQIVVTPDHVKCVSVTGRDFGSTPKDTSSSPALSQKAKEIPKLNPLLARNQPILISRKGTSDKSLVPRNFTLLKPPITAQR